MVSSLLPPALFAGVSGTSLVALQLSPDGKRLALLFERPKKGSSAPPATHTQLLPGVLVYDFDADETLLLGALPMHAAGALCASVILYKLETDHQECHDHVTYLSRRESC